MDTVKSTVNINRAYKEQLDQFVRLKQISSLTEGINAALALYIKSMQREMYAKQMLEAAKDPAFLERTMTTQNSFEHVDAELDGAGGEEW